MQSVVNFQSKTRGQQGEVFVVHPKKVSIQPHEYIYVSVQFKPPILGIFEGSFEALVENVDQNSKSNLLQFNLRGEASIPSLKIDFPTEINNEGKL